MLCDIDDIENLSDNWDGVGGKRPHAIVINNAKKVLKILKSMELIPRSMIATPDGGVAFTFLNGTKYADFECVDKECAVVLSEDLTDRSEKIIELSMSEKEIKNACAQIRLFLMEKK